MNDHLREFESGAATDIGKLRLENEDSYLVLPESGIWAVADGMGGLEAGAFASATVVDALQAIGETASLADLCARCQDRLAKANQRLLRIADEHGIRIGTTLAALLTHEGTYACLWAGDSRIYLVRDGRITQMTRDHSEVAELVAEGILSAEGAKTWARRNVITRAIGIYDELDAEITQGILEKGDIFIICSDGLTAHVSDPEILEIARDKAPQSACDALVALTLERGAIDNVTVIITRYLPRDGSRGHGPGLA